VLSVVQGESSELAYAVREDEREWIRTDSIRQKEARIVISTARLRYVLFVVVTGEGGSNILLAHRGRVIGAIRLCSLPAYSEGAVWQLS